MSYERNEFNSNPNSYGVQGSQDSNRLNDQGNTYNPSEGGDFNTQGSGLRNQYAGNTSDISNPGAGGNFAGGTGQSATSTSDRAFAGNTTDFSNPGAGGDFGGVGREGHRQSDVRSQGQWDSSTGTGTGTGSHNDWQNDERTGDNYNTGSTGTGKPSLGDRLKGTTEKMAGTLSGNQTLKERGQERKTGQDEY
ncbi:hypothetical protein K474DRAFT_1701782 [Panus rudis PR-1116 ss-1]|nr:hypothetical protein K474DRAFT_1701782 [Panus rudis PR-1116 ss-1]